MSNVMTSPKFSADELFAARAVYDRLGRGSASDEQSIAIALAKSHATGFAEGMKRAAEIARSHGEYWNEPDVAEAYARGILDALKAE